jgi:hypothetical protein
MNADHKKEKTAEPDPQLRNRYCGYKSPFRAINKSAHLLIS